MEMSGQVHGFSPLTPSERAHGTHWIGGYVGLRTSLDAVEKRKIRLINEITMTTAYISDF
jgi:hypothetical protein